MKIFKGTILLALMLIGLNSAITVEASASVSTVPEVSFSYAKVCRAPPPSTSTTLIACKIGTIGPGGGYIFFVDYYNQYPGFTYLEAAPTDTAAVAAWCNPTTFSIYPSFPLTTAQLSRNKGVGQGKTNTANMIALCVSGAANDAVNYSTSTAPSGQWFLPSLGELKLMRDNLLGAGVGDLSNDWYWSSTEFYPNSAWAHNSVAGYSIVESKSNARSVRAIRYL